MAKNTFVAEVNFKNVEERPTSKNCCRVSLVSLVSKAFQKLANNRFVDHLEKCSLFLFPVWFQVFLIDCRSSDSCI